MSIRTPAPSERPAGYEDSGAIDRFAEHAARSLEPMFAPRAIAVVGASHRATSPGGAAFRALVSNGFPGPVYAVTRSGGEVAGHPAYASLRDLPGPVDLVVIAIPAPGVLDAARDAHAIGARALVVLSSGFREEGPEGAVREAELAELARETGMRILGPNCLGIAVTTPGSAFNATFGPAQPPEGRIALASQSGGLGIGALAFCASRGIGLSAFVSLGNKADISGNDLLAYWDQDPRTKVILLYLESFGNPRRFARLARHVARGTPIVAIKSGRSAAGARAAGSHTAALAAGEAPTNALLRLAGVSRAETVEELFEAGQALADQPLAAGRRVAILSNAGGPGILAADSCEGRAIEVPAFSRRLQDALREAVPAIAGTSNPVDLGAGAGPDAFRRGIGEVIASGECDAVIAIYTPTEGGDLDGVARAIQDHADGRVPVLGCIFGGAPRLDATDLAHPVPWFAFPESAVRALGHSIDAHAATLRINDPIPRLRDVDPDRARAALADTAPGAWLSTDALAEILAAYGIPAVPSRLATTPEEAEEAQRAFGRPVAVKLVSSTITHKTDVGGVVLGCTSPAAAAAAFGAIQARAEAAEGPGAMQGVLVQPVAPDGIDTIIGGVQDRTFGPLVLAGMGGITAELWGDRTVALAPVGRTTAAEMWDSLRGRRLLGGYRGTPEADIEGLVDCVLRVARLVADQPLLAEIDLNPVRALPRGGGVLALDARARRAD